ncbi:hypothetical protein [Chitinophaga lutea]|uniref:hypothetical protein n=1 Tax=Chitinophaga lutea TaxID=2488634 RepID=UPI001C70A9CA|nr:hypothetical protein [Chitinophaga lutea]
MRATILLLIAFFFVTVAIAVILQDYEIIIIGLVIAVVSGVGCQLLKEPEQ